MGWGERPCVHTHGGVGIRKRAAQWAARFTSNYRSRSVTERGDATSKLGLAVRGLVLVDDALGDGDVQLARSDTQSGESLVLVAGLNGLARVTDQGLQLGTSRTGYERGASRW